MPPNFNSRNVFNSSSRRPSFRFSVNETGAVLCYKKNLSTLNYSWLSYFLLRSLGGEKPQKQHDRMPDYQFQFDISIIERLHDQCNQVSEIEKSAKEVPFQAISFRPTAPVDNRSKSSLSQSYLKLLQTAFSAKSQCIPGHHF